MLDVIKDIRNYIFSYIYVFKDCVIINYIYVYKNIHGLMQVHGVYKPIFLEKPFVELVEVTFEMTSSEVNIVFCEIEI